jgi:hypothetical protein
MASRSAPIPRVTVTSTSGNVPTTSSGPLDGLQNLLNFINPFYTGPTPQLPGINPGASHITPGAPVGQAADSAAGLITDTTSFLQAIAWLFTRKNMLRIVEFIIGTVLVGFGFWAALQARGERGEGFTTGESALSRSGLGRVSRALAMNTRGGGRARVESAPHRTRRTALKQRYTREQRVRQREQKGNTSNTSRKRGK